MRDLIGRLSQRLGLRRDQTERTVELFDEGNTLPFVARYRKEYTGNLDEAVLARFRDELNALRKLESRQETVLQTIREQGSLTPDLETAIEEAETLQQVEDLYLPYKPKRQTRAQKARERGLEPIAAWILEQLDFDMTREQAVYGYVNEAVPTFEDAWQGARDIVAEIISEDVRIRDIVRQLTWDNGELVTSATNKDLDDKQKYELYYEFAAWLRNLKPHQVLAINRGEQDDVLRVKVSTFDNVMIDAISEYYPTNPISPLRPDLEEAIKDAYKRLISPSIEREVRTELKRWADEHGINVFATNLRNLLLTPPIKGSTILGVDPGYRTGCKLAVVDPTGKVLDTDVIYPHQPRRMIQRSLSTLEELVKRYQIDLIAIGNGTASRETEELSATLIAEGVKVKYLVISEAGASVYSASELARQELPDMDVSLRGAVSIARRVQDPLAELVKIDPKSIGVGMYQHDVDQKALQESLDWVIESVVNAVGVDVNTASPALLQHVAGLGPKLASNIVEHRDQKGEFKTRKKILKVSGMGPKSFEQAAGFLRISDGKNPLDNTGIHPESYVAVDRLLALLNTSLDDAALVEKLRKAQQGGLKKLAQTLEIGVPTLTDIIRELQKPGRDPRDDVPAPILRDYILKMEDLTPGMKLKGTVRNVVDFGAFVDVGVKQDGLVHISEMSEQYVQSPYELLDVGDIIEVTVLEVDLDRGRIGLSMKG